MIFSISIFPNRLACFFRIFQCQCECIFSFKNDVLHGAFCYLSKKKYDLECEYFPMNLLLHCACDCNFIDCLLLNRFIFKQFVNIILHSYAFYLYSLIKLNTCILLFSNFKYRFLIVF